MKAVILAAGRGSRLRPIVGAGPKCLAEVGGRTLIARQIETLHACGVTEVVTVLGHQREAVERACGSDIEVVHNTRFAQTNSLYSLWLARHLLRDGFLVLNCDVLFHPHLLTRLLGSAHEDALLLAAREPETTYSDEEMKVTVRDGRVCAMDKRLPDPDIDGENVGIAKFGPEGAAVLVDEMNALIAQGGARDWLPRAFHAFAQRRPLHVVETGTLPWIEIDFPHDYRKACREVWPAIAAGTAPVDPDRITGSALGEALFSRMFHRVRTLL
ncbi:MAG: NTP transferase domain-containing protein [Vicinamibacterales bacterium]